MQPAESSLCHPLPPDGSEVALGTSNDYELLLLLVNAHGATEEANRSIKFIYYRTSLQACG